MLPIELLFFKPQKNITKKTGEVELTSSSDGDVFRFVGHLFKGLDVKFFQDVVQARIGRETFHDGPTFFLIGRKFDFASVFRSDSVEISNIEPGRNERFFEIDRCANQIPVKTVLRNEIAGNIRDVSYIYIKKEYRKLGYAKKLLKYFANKNIEGNKISYYSYAADEISEKLVKSCGFTPCAKRFEG